MGGKTSSSSSDCASEPAELSSAYLCWCIIIVFEPNLLALIPFNRSNPASWNGERRCEVGPIYIMAAELFGSCAFRSLTAVLSDVGGVIFFGGKLC